MKIMNFIMVLGLVACGPIRVNKRTGGEDPAIKELKTQLLQLQGTIAMINAFVASDFSDCSSGLPSFETKVCQIAQTATAEQRVLFTAQLGEVAKVFQEEIFGEDCIDSIDVGCPVSGSITSDVSTLQSDTSTFTADMAAAVADISALQSDLASLELRMTSAESAITGIQSTIVTVESRLDGIEDILSTGTVYKTIQLCEDNAASGPIYEAVIMDGDNLTITAFITTGSKNGLGYLRQQGDGDGDTHHSTRVNTKKCNFNVYDTGSELKLCWDNDTRGANQASIDTTCDSANSFATPAADCTCTL